MSDQLKNTEQAAAATYELKDKIMGGKKGRNGSEPRQSEKLKNKGDLTWKLWKLSKYGEGKREFWGLEGWSKHDQSAGVQGKKGREAMNQGRTGKKNSIWEPSGQGTILMFSLVSTTQLTGYSTKN